MGRASKHLRLVHTSIYLSKSDKVGALAADLVNRQNIQFKMGLVAHSCARKPYTPNTVQRILCAILALKRTCKHNFVGLPIPCDTPQSRRQACPLYTLQCGIRRLCIRKGRRPDIPWRAFDGLWSGPC